MKLNVLKLFRELMKLGHLETEQGVLIYEGDVLVDGTEVFIEDESGSIIPAPDGEYCDYTVKDGKIVTKEVEEVTEPEPEPVAQEEVEEVAEPEPEPVVEPEPEPEPEPDHTDERITSLETKVAELEQMIAGLKEKQEQLEFSALKPAEKQIKDNVINTRNGAMKYFK